MTTRKLTERQRQALEAVEAAHAAGTGLSAYARASGLDPRRLHDAVTGLRKRGMLPATTRPRKRKNGFVAVQVVSTPTRLPAVPRPTAREGMVCRLVHACGFVIECGEWPPPAWLAAVTAERRDAAP